MGTVPSLVIAATGSGVGKTSLTLGLARCLARQGLRVQTFKVGPDFLDPSYLALASGRTCYNLDGWMTSRDYVSRLFARATADADIALVEGVMGLFDGASPHTLEGSTAEIALWLGAPVLLVVNAHGSARSLAATVQGFAQFDPNVRIAGVIANHGGSPRHRIWLSESLASAGAAPLVGMLPSGSLPTLPSRHLGLVTADATNLSAAILDQLADACSQHLDVPAIIELARVSPLPLGEGQWVRAAGEIVHDFFAAAMDCQRSNAATNSRELTAPEAPEHAFRELLAPGYSANIGLQGIKKPRRIRLGIARDEAFHFYYPDNLESLAEAGAEWAPFSPLYDAHLPENLDGLYFGGGYPEIHAAQLADNAAMLADVRRFAASGRSIYAECGGLMYLGQTLTTLDGARHPLVGLLPIHTGMLEKFNALGYVEVTLTGDSIWGPRGAVFRGHEFHYSELTEPFPADSGWQKVYSVQRRLDSPAQPEGFQKGRILASYVHSHFASQPWLIESFLASCEGQS